MSDIITEWPRNNRFSNAGIFIYVNSYVWGLRSRQVYSPSLSILYVYTLPLSEFLPLQKNAPNISLRVVHETLAAERYVVFAVELSRSCWGRGNSWPRVSEAGPEDVQSLLTHRRDAWAEDTTGSGLISVTSEMSRAPPATQLTRKIFTPDSSIWLVSSSCRTYSQGLVWRMH